MNKTQIDIRKDQVIGSADGRLLLGDLYLPEPSGMKQRPAVVLLFGGSWLSGERSQQKVYGITLAQAGFVCLAADYRWSTEAIWPAQLDDVQTAIRWLRQHAVEFAINPDRISVSGNSSGGHLALMAGAMNDNSPSSPDSDSNQFSATVRSICAFYPPVRLAGLDVESGDDTVATLLGPEATPADYERASPMTYSGNPLPPVLLMSGSDDQRVPVRHSYELQQALEAAGNEVDLHVFSSQGHAFDAQLGFAQLCAVIMTDFFKRHG